MSKRFDDPEFEELCINFWEYVRAHRYFSPRLPPAFSFVLESGSGNADVDYPLNPYFPAFITVIDHLEELERIAFYSVYICSFYRHGKKLPIKSIANEMGINKANFYKKANNVARKSWRKTKDLSTLSRRMVKQEDIIID